MRKLRMHELKRLSVEEFHESPKNPFVIALDDVRSQLNVGSVFRSTDAFRGEEILLGGLSPTPSREMRKTALGATDSVSWRHRESLVAKLQHFRKCGYEIWAIEQTEGALSLMDWKIPDHHKTVFIFGNEVTGVSDELLALCTGAIEIPQFGTKHSLNVSVSAGLIMWEYIRQRNHL